MSDTSGEGLQKSQGKSAMIRFGVYGQPGSYAGMTIRQVRAELADLWQIPADAKGYKGKEVLSDDYVIQPNDVIDYHRQLGEKG